MNDKKDDSKGRTDPLDDTASLLESLFKDTKSSQIKVVRRRIRPKSGVKKRVISKQRIDEGKEASQTPFRKQGRPSPSQKSAEVTKSKILSRKKPLPGSILPKDSKTERNRQRLRRKSTAGAKPTIKSNKSGEKRITRPRDLKQEKPSSKIIAGSDEERTESLDQSVLNSMISMASGIKGSRKSPSHERPPEQRQLLKTKKRGGEKTSEAEDLQKGAPADIEEISGTDEEITEVMEKTTIDSMISELEGSGKKGDEKASAKESPVPEEDEEITQVMEKATLDSMISELEGSGKEGDEKASVKKSPVPEEDEEITQVMEKAALDSMISGLEGSGKEGDEKTSVKESPVPEEDEEITEVMGKTTLDSMISGLEGSGKKEDEKASVKKSPVPEEDEDTAEIFFDSDEPRVVDSAEIEGITGADEEITQVMEKATLDSMISELEGSEKEGDEKASVKKSPVPEEEEAGVEIFFDSDEPRVVDSAEIEGIAKSDEEIMEVLEKSALNTMISTLEGSGKQGDDRVSAEESSLSEEVETSVGIVVDSDDLKEEVSADTEGIDRATEEDTLSQEKPAAPSSIIIEDSLLGARAHEAYPASGPEEEPIPEDREEVVEEAPQAVDLEEEQPSDSADAELVEEKSLSEEKPAASTPILSKIPETKADVFEVHHILEDKEGSILEDKKEGIERASGAVGLEIEPLSDSSGPAKEEPRFQETPVSSLMSSKDSEISTDEEEHYRLAAEEEPVPKGEEDDIERVSEPAESGKDELARPEEGVALTEEELQLIERSGRRSKVIRIGLPLVLFGILAVILSIKYSPLDFFRREQVQKPVSDRSVEVSSPKKQEVTQEPMSKRAPTTRQRNQPSTRASGEKEIVRAPVPKKRDAAPDTQMETVAAVTPKIQPSSSEPPTILAMKESVEESSPIEQRKTPKTSKETFAATDQKVQPEPPGPVTSPPPSDIAAKAEAKQKEISLSYPYSVYLGSYGTPERVEKAVSKYKENGLSSLHWQEVDLGDKGIWYRVFSGQFETKSGAEAYIRERQLVDAEVRKIERDASKGSVSVKGTAPQAKAPEKKRSLPEATAELSYPYSVYVGSYKDPDRARKAASDLQTKGPSFWVKIDLGDKGIWYRVYIGCFQTRDQAETFIEDHQIVDGESRQTTYANLIGTYSSEEELDRMRLSLLNLGFSPYVIEASGGQSHLFTGAFYQKANAEKEQLDLKAKGIQSQLVKR